MNIYSTEKIRNVGLFGHQGAGKTSLSEALLYCVGVTDRLGKVENGNTASDFDPDEIKRAMSVFSALTPIEWNGNKINVIDTPGFFDFVADSLGALRVVDCAVLVAAANSGIEVGLEKIWGSCESRSKARIMFVNKMDKENANFTHIMDEAKEKLSGARVIPIQLPIGAADSFKGVVDLIDRKAYSFDAKGVPTEIPVPEEMADEIEEAREAMVEAAAEATDELTEKFFEEMELSVEDIKTGLKILTANGAVVPALCGSSISLAGVRLLADAILEYVPAPNYKVEAKDGDENAVEIAADPKAPVVALIFKTSSDPYVGKISYLRVFAGTLHSDTVLHNLAKGVDEKIGNLLFIRGKSQEKIGEAQPGDIVAIGRLGISATGDTLSDPTRKVVLPGLDLPRPFFSKAIRAKSKADEDKLSANLQRLLQEDPTLQLERVEETHQSVLTGIGDVQLDLCVERLKRMGVDVELYARKIPYRETIKGTVSETYRHKKQAGGRGQFAQVSIEITGLPSGSGFVFEDNIVGGVVSKNYIPAVEKGVRKAMEGGILAGNPVVDVKVRLFDGKMHEVDSSDMAFQIAGLQAFKTGAPKAKPVILEPIINVEVIVPDSYMGDVIGDLNSKRGRISGRDPVGNGLQCVKAQVPLSEMQRYAIDLRSITQGRGSFVMEFDHYEETPHDVAEQVIKEAQAAAEAK